VSEEESTATFIKAKGFNGELLEKNRRYHNADFKRIWLEVMLVLKSMDLS